MTPNPTPNPTPHPLTLTPTRPPTLTLTLSLTRFVTTTYDALCGNFVLHLRRLRLTNYLLVTFDASQQERLGLGLGLGSASKRA